MGIIDSAKRTYEAFTFLVAVVNVSHSVYTIYRIYTKMKKPDLFND